MSTEIIPSPAPAVLPALFAPTPKAARRVAEFFTAQPGRGILAARPIECDNVLTKLSLDRSPAPRVGVETILTARHS
jgi:hypothetical protein